MGVCQAWGPRAAAALPAAGTTRVPMAPGLRAPSLRSRSPRVPWGHSRGLRSVEDDGPRPRRAAGGRALTPGGRRGSPQPAPAPAPPGGALTAAPPPRPASRSPSPAPAARRSAAAAPAAPGSGRCGGRCRAEPRGWRPPPGSRRAVRLARSARAAPQVRGQRLSGRRPAPARAERLRGGGPSPGRGELVGGTRRGLPAGNAPGGVPKPSGTSAVAS